MLYLVMLYLVMLYLVMLYLVMLYLVMLYLVMLYLVGMGWVIRDCLIRLECYDAIVNLKNNLKKIETRPFDGVSSEYREIQSV